MTWLIVIDLNPDEYNQALLYYPFMVNLDRCNGSFKGLNNPSSKMCAPNKTKYVNLSALKSLKKCR